MEFVFSSPALSYRRSTATQRILGVGRYYNFSFSNFPKALHLAVQYLQPRRLNCVPWSAKRINPQQHIHQHRHPEQTLQTTGLSFHCRQVTYCTESLQKIHLFPFLADFPFICRRAFYRLAVILCALLLYLEGEDRCMCQYTPRLHWSPATCQTPNFPCMLWKKTKKTAGCIHCVVCAIYGRPAGLAGVDKPTSRSSVPLLSHRIRLCSLYVRYCSWMQLLDNQGNTMTDWTGQPRSDHTQAVKQFWLPSLSPW